MDTIQVLDAILEDETDEARAGSKLAPAEMTKANPLTDFNGKWN